MLFSAPTVKSVCDTERLGCLIKFCHIIMANMSDSNELQIFNLPTGLRKVCLKLSEAFQNQRRTSTTDLRHTSGISPSLSDLIAFLERKCREFSDLAYEKKVREHQGNARLGKKTALKTSMSDEPDSSKFPCTSVASESPFHPTGKHPQVSVSHSARSNFLRRFISLKIKDVSSLLDRTLRSNARPR